MSNPYDTPGANLANSTGETYQPQFFAVSGRIGRLRYLAYVWGALMLSYLAMIPLMMIAGVFGAAGASGSPEAAMSGPLMFVVAALYVFIIVVSCIYARRRLHDLDKSGWWLLVSLVPVVNFLFGIYVTFFPGTAGANRFGPAPAANSGGVIALFIVLLVLFSISIIGILAAVSIPAYQDYVKRAESMQLEQLQE